MFFKASLSGAEAIRDLQLEICWAATKRLQGEILIFQKAFFSQVTWGQVKNLT